MSVKLNREGWLQLFTQMRRAPGFFSRLFTIKPGGIYNGTKVAIDIERYGEDVAVAIKKCTGPNLNDIDKFTTKEFEPPSYGEAFSLDVCELLDRMAGVDPYTAAYQEYAGDFTAKSAKGFMLIFNKIQRAVELQASQILQTGKLTLTNKTGDTVYELDYKPKTAHFPATSTTWGDSGDDKIGDLTSLAEEIRANGQVDPDMLVFGSVALREFLKDSEVKDLLDNRRVNIGEINPRMVDSGATFHGFVWLGDYEFQIWSNKSTYKDPETGDIVKYMTDDKVVVMSSNTRLDMTSARVPLPLGPDPRVADLVPPRMSSREQNFDVTPNVYPTPNGKQIMGELESRPLLIPVQIDGFGCLTTTAP